MTTAKTNGEDESTTPTSEESGQSTTVGSMTSTISSTEVSNNGHSVVTTDSSGRYTFTFNCPIPFDIYNITVRAKNVNDGKTTEDLVGEPATASERTLPIGRSFWIFVFYK